MIGILRAAAAAIVLLPLSGVASAEEWPTGLVTIVAHSSPGGGNDIMARNLGPALQAKYGVDYVVQNVTGGSGAVAANFMAEQAERDGHTIQMVTPTQLITPLRSPGIPTYRDMTPVAMMLMDPTMLYVHRDSPFQTIEEFIEHARDNPRDIAVGIGSAGSLDQLILQNFQREVGVEVRTVPHEGGGAAVVALLGQHVDAVLGEPGQALSHLQEGTLRVLAVFQEERLEGYEDVPTMTELGYDVISTKYRGVFAPPEVPEETLKAMEAALQEIYDVEPFKSYYENASLEPRFMGSEEFTQFLDRANAEFEEFVAGLN
jgi:putative tricarboxylic transport membrane protein